MANVVTNKHLMGTSEITLIAKIKPGLVPIAEPVTYGRRLRLVLNLLFEIRKQGVERDGLVGSAGPLESLRTLHHIHWSIHDDDRKLLLAVSFDGHWEAYIRDIVEKAGPLLDLIFCHCEGYVGHSCYDGYPEFSEWVRAQQISCDFFYAGTPDLSIDDIRYLQALERTYASNKPNFDLEVAKLHVGDPPPNNNATLIEQRVSRLQAIQQALQGFFPESSAQDSTNDRLLFKRAVQLLGSFIAPPPANTPASPPPPGEVAPSREQGSPATNVSAHSAALSSESGSNRPASSGCPHAAFAQVAPREEPTAEESPPSASPTLPDTYLDDSARELIQGNILTEYPNVSVGRLLLVRLPNGNRRLDALAFLESRLTTEHQTERLPEVTYNVGFTYSGLAAAGLPSDLLAAYPKEFQEGMAARAGVLGDIGPFHPDRWELPTYRSSEQSNADCSKRRVDLAMVDLVLLLQAPSKQGAAAQAALDAAVHELEREGLFVLHERPLIHPGKSPEGGPFGFADHVSQPIPVLKPGQEPRGDNVPLGELLLGYKNARGELGPRPVEFFKNSTFLVIRDFRLHLSHFKDWAGTVGDEVTEALMGRTRDGRPLVAPHTKDNNDFKYDDDPNGALCPFSAHVRRANPRIVNEVYARRDSKIERHKVGSPRILRRGFLYSKEQEENSREQEEAGLMFMALNASIADQYEVIQRWINGANIAGGFSAHPDIFAGPLPEGDGPPRHLTLQINGQVRKVPLPKKPFSGLKWGLYLFMPSKAALTFMVEQLKAAPLKPAPAPVRVLDEGGKLVKSLLELERQDPQRAFSEWKRYLEDLDLRPQAAAIWAHVRKRGGALKTAYGTLVGSHEGVLEVLKNSDVYSVRRYHERMEETFGGHYLGMDPAPEPLNDGYPVTAGQYQRESRAANAYLMSITWSDAFEKARRHAQTYLAQVRYAAKTLPRDVFPVVPLDVQKLGREVVARVAAEVFEIPELAHNAGDPGPDAPSVEPPLRCPVDFQRVSQHVFHPNPSEPLREFAKARGSVIKAAVHTHIDKKGIAALPAWLAEAAQGQPDPVAFARKTLIGSINGFVVPTSGSFTSIVAQWLKSKELWRWQSWLWLPENRWLVEGSPSDDQLRTCELLLAAEYTMMRAPIPDLLHRLTVRPTVIGAEVLEPRSHVVISLSSAAADKPDPAILFGGARVSADPEQQSPLHACPGRPMAEGVLLGALVELLNEPELRVLDRTTVGIRHAASAGSLSSTSAQ